MHIFPPRFRARPPGQQLALQVAVERRHDARDALAQAAVRVAVEALHRLGERPQLPRERRRRHGCVPAERGGEAGAAQLGARDAHLRRAEPHLRRRAAVLGRGDRAPAALGPGEVPRRRVRVDGQPGEGPQAQEEGARVAVLEQRADPPVVVEEVEERLRPAVRGRQVLRPHGLRYALRGREDGRAVHRALEADLPQRAEHRRRLERPLREALLAEERHELRHVRVVHVAGPAQLAARVRHERGAAQGAEQRLAALLRGGAAEDGRQRLEELQRDEVAVAAGGHGAEHRQHMLGVDRLARRLRDAHRAVELRVGVLRHEEKFP